MLLRKSGPFAWSEEAEQAFRELKQHLASLPILVALEPGELLYLYIVAAVEAVSMVLVAEREAQGGQEPGSLGVAIDTRTIQKPVYYVSEVLHEAKAGTSRHTNSSTPCWSRPGSCVIISKCTRLWW
jgi:hypothetical protein